VACTGLDTIEVSVRDDGVGLPKSFQANKNGGLGMRIVGALTKQLNGRIEQRSGVTGTEFVLSFPLESQDVKQ
jgi:two-component sensor histidine kinase